MADDELEGDDLFDDLYQDDEVETKTQAAVPTTVKSPVAPDVSNVSHAEADVGTGQNGGGDQNMYGGEQAEEEDDDEIDFNLGGNTNGGDYNTNYEDNSSNSRGHGGPGIKEDGKMFIGGLNWETTDESLKDYFSQFGEVAECTVMRDGATGRSRGFGFLTFKDAKTVNIVMVKEHYLDGKIIDPKRAIPRDEQEKTSKIFVGGVSQEASEQDFKEYFMQFGRVIDATLMMDKDTGRPRGFGFVTFDSEAAVDLCLQQPLEIHGKPIEVKKAQPRGNMREEESNAGRGKFANRQQNDYNNNNSNQGMLQNNAMSGAPAGMTPQLMAQYWQRMQQYFAMMQQQMAMGRGMGGGMQMNPAMMQQMQQMQQMQAAQMQGGNGNGAGMQMNPAMMQQMQQMQQMQMQGGGGQGGPGGASNPGGNGVGYNAYEQQMFEQQKYDQQSQKRAQQGYGGGYGGGANGGPTSWEGMYDDVPQPTPPAGRGGFGRGGSQRGSVPPSGGGTPAPPAGAPTGPKNAGKPGANYRGGGRGGRGGFHPYARGA